MSKELEILEDISKEECLFKDRNTIYMGGEKSNSFTHKDTIGNYFKGIEEIKQALQRLESIDNANPSEALEILDDLKNGLVNKETGMIMFNQVWFKNQIDTIKQALLKTQEMKKEYNDYGSARERWKIICQMIKRMFGFDIEEKWSDDDKVITQTLIKAQESEKDNARNEEILQKYYQEGITLDSIRALKQERDNYKKALSIIKEKDVDIYILQSCKTVDEYNSKIVHITGETRELTKEEFDTLKE